MTIAFASNPNKRFAVSQVYQPPFNISDPYFKYTTLLLPGIGSDAQTNNSFLDSGTGNSGGPFTVSRQGNPTQGTFSPFYNGGFSRYFSSYETYDLSNGLTSWGAGLSTVELWLNSPGRFGFAIAYDCVAQNNRYVLSLGSNGKIGVTFTTGTGSQFDLATTNTLSFNVWNHIAIQIDATTNTSAIITIYLNGVGETFSPQNMSSQTGYYQNPQVGRSITGCFSFANDTGYVCDYRIVKNQQVYTGNFTPPTKPLGISGSASASSYTNLANVSTSWTAANCIMLAYSASTSDPKNIATGSSIAISTSSSNRSLNLSPFAPTASWSAATYGGSGYFDGSGDYLSIGDSTAFDLPGDFTIEFWVYPLNVSSSPNFCTLGSSSASNNGFLLYYSNGATSIRFYSNGASVAPGPAMTNNRWYHIAIVRSGSGSNNLVMFVDGVSVTSVTNTTSFTGVAGNGFCVGAEYTSSYNVLGEQYLSSLRLIKGTAVYTGNFTPPSLAPLTTAGSTSAAAYPSTTNVNTSFASSACSLLLNFTNAGIYDATSKNDLETVGDAQISNTTAKWGSTSIKFDGTGDYLTNNNASNPLLAFGTGDFTIEGWFYSNDASSATQRGMFQTSDTIGGLKTTYTTGVVMNHGSTGEISVNIGGTTYSTSGASITTGAWFYFAITRSSGNVNVYINGVSRASGSGNTSNLTGTYISVGGYYNTSFLFNGYIQDLRITRYARTITASPTAPFPTL